MKKYIIFAVSFIVVFSLFQVLSGLFLTYTYTPDLTEAWSSSGKLPQETIIKSSNSPFLPTLFIAFLSASIAYVILQKVANIPNRSKKGFNMNIKYR